MPPPSLPGPNDPLNDLALWIPVVSDPKRDWVEGRLRLRCRSSDPSLESPEMEQDPSELAVLLLRMKAMPLKGSSSAAYGMASLYYASRSDTDFKEEDSVRFRVPLDGRMREYIISLTFNVETRDRIQRMRFDPLDQPGICEVERFSLRPGDCLQAKDRELETEERLANDRSSHLQLSLASEVCMGFPEPFGILNELGEDGPHRIGLFARRTEKGPRWEKDLPFPAAAWGEVLSRVRRIGLMASSDFFLEDRARLSRFSDCMKAHGCLLDLWTDLHLLEDGASEVLSPILDRIVFMMDDEKAALKNDVSRRLQTLFSQPNLRGRPSRVILGFRKAYESPGGILPLIQFAADQGVDGVFLPWLEGPQNMDPFGSLAASECEMKGLSLMGPGPPEAEWIEKASASAGSYWCRVPWTRVFLGPEGDLHLCWLHGGVSDMGRLEGISLFEAWNGERYRTSRKELAEVKNEKSLKPGACVGCPFRQKP